MPQTLHDFLFVTQDSAVLTELSQISQKNKWSFLATASGKQTLEILDQESFKCVLIDLSLDGISGLQLLEWMKANVAGTEVIMISEANSVELAIRSLKLGAIDYLTKPLGGADKVAHCMAEALSHHELMHRLPQYAAAGLEKGDFKNMIGKSPQMQAISEMITNIAASDSNVLIQGESGTGKELVAHAIHYYSARKKGPFVVINCAAMPEALLESELFGYQKGAFTGAVQDKDGLFEVANGGTVFLDEIGEIPLSTQVKLLRVLQESEIRRIGDTASRTINVRIIAATNKDLSDLVRAGKFRDDLYYRLNVINIPMPRLCERKDDVVLLANHFLSKLSRKIGKPIGKIAVDAMQALQNYSWPGNVRELENVIERAIVLSDGHTVTAKNLPPKILSDSFYNAPETEGDLTEMAYQEAKKRALNIFNRSYILALFDKTGGNITAAAEKAGMDRSNFKKILRKYHLENRSKK